MAKVTSKPITRLDPREWVPLTEAQARVAALVGSDLGDHDLHRDLLEGRLPSAYRRIAKDGSEKCGQVKPSWWQEGWGWWSSILSRVVYPAPDGQPAGNDRFGFYVRRGDLDRCYPVADAGEAAAPRKERRKRHRRKGSRPQKIIRDIAAEKFPGGYHDIPMVDIRKVVGAEMEARGLKVPERTTFVRAFGRRKG